MALQVRNLNGGNWGVFNTETGRLISRQPTFTRAQNVKSLAEQTRQRVQRLRQEEQKRQQTNNRKTKRTAKKRTAKKTTKKKSARVSAPKLNNLFGQPSRSQKGKAYKLLKQTISNQTPRGRTK